jgi:hypothetical protein
MTCIPYAGWHSPCKPIMARLVAVVLEGTSVNDGRFDLAKWVLLGVGVLLALGGIAFLWSSRGELIFNALIMVLPPIATLVLTYFFTRKQ